MTYDINTLDELIEALERPAKAARVIGTSPQSVCNWKGRGYLPPSRHLTALILLKQRGKTVNPAIFERTEDDWRVLGLLPEHAA